MRTNAETAAATVGADEAAIESVKLQVDYCTIRSPMTGYAGRIMIQQGNLVKANDTNSLVVVNQVLPIYTSFSVPEQNLPRTCRRYQADGEAAGDRGDRQFEPSARSRQTLSRRQQYRYHDGHDQAQGRVSERRLRRCGPVNSSMSC